MFRRVVDDGGANFRMLTSTQERAGNILRDYSGTFSPGLYRMFRFHPIGDAGVRIAGSDSVLIFKEKMVAGGGLEPPTCGL